MVSPTYRQRLRIEGWVLALGGAVGTVALLALSGQALRDPLDSVGQLATLGLVLAWLGPRSARRAISASRSCTERDLGSGQPTPAWQLIAIVGVLTAAAGLLAGGDAAVRVSGGCVLVGLTQALVLERIVAADEHATGRTHFRVAGSRVLRGTRLGNMRR